MKTLIINGSPRKNGDTVSLLNILRSKIQGEISQVDTYFCGIKPCIDCRYCFTHNECAIKDDMQTVYSQIIEADNIVIASPIYFSEVSGSMLNVLSRLQYFYVSRYFRKEDLLSNKKRNGIIILCGGGDGSPVKAFETATTLLHQMGAEVVGKVCSHNTNNIPAKDDKKAIANIREIAKRLNL